MAVSHAAVLLIVMLSVMFCAEAKNGVKGRGGASGSSYHFVQFTDIHLEPFYYPGGGQKHGAVCRAPEAYNKTQCVPFFIEPTAEIYPLGRLNCDGPMALLESMIEHVALQSKTARPEFAVFTGDLPGHQLSCQHHQADTIDAVISNIARLLPHIDTIFPAMGNNDYFPNYNISLEPNNAWQELIANKYQKHGILNGSQLETFRRGGYYSAKPKPGLRLIVLNTVVWSQKVLDYGATTKVTVIEVPDADIANYHGPDEPLAGADDSGWAWNTETATNKEFVSCAKRPRDPYNQFAWMQAELKEAKTAGEVVIIAGHIPPGDKVGENNFCADHLADFISATNQYKDIIEVQIYGDHSNDEFRMVWDESGGEQGASASSSVLVSAGLTPRKHCNPSWRMFEVAQDDHDVYDFVQYYLPLMDANLELESNKSKGLKGTRRATSHLWQKQYSFREQYGVGLDPEDLEALWVSLQTNPSVMRQYLKNMFSQTVGTEDYYDYICDMRFLDEKRGEECTRRGRVGGIDLAPRGFSGLLEQPRGYSELGEGEVATIAKPIAKASVSVSDREKMLMTTCALLAATTAGLAWKVHSLSFERHNPASVSLLS